MIIRANSVALALHARTYSHSYGLDCLTLLEYDDARVRAWTWANSMLHECGRARVRVCVCVYESRYSMVIITNYIMQKGENENENGNT